MKTLTPLFFIAALAGSTLLTGCGDTTTHTTVKKETKIDDNGNEKTKIETKTETVSNSGGDRNSSTTKEVRVEGRDDPIVKLGPVEINKR